MSDHTCPLLVFLEFFFDFYMADLLNCLLHHRCNLIHGVIWCAMETVLLDSEQLFAQLQHFFPSCERIDIHDNKIAFAVLG